MGLFEKLFPRRPPGGDARAFFKTLTAYQPVYTTYRGGLYEMELTRAAIATFARHCSKLHLELTGDARPELARVLGQQPNPWMDASTPLSCRWRTRRAGSSGISPCCRSSPASARWTASRICYTAFGAGRTPRSSFPARGF